MLGTGSTVPDPRVRKMSFSLTTFFFKSVTFRPTPEIDISVSKLLGFETFANFLRVSVSVSENLVSEKKSRYRFRKIWYRKKVSVSVSVKILVSSFSGYQFVNILEHATKTTHFDSVSPLLQYTDGIYPL